MISSMFASAMANPSRMCPRSRALRNSNTVRRVTTSRRCRRNASSISFRLSSRGWPSTSATMLMPNTCSIGVCAYRLLSRISGTSPRFSSITTRMPSLSDSSRRPSEAMPSMSLSRTRSAMRSISRALFTWYGSSVMMMACRSPLPDVLEVGARAHVQPAAPGLVGRDDFLGAVDESRGGEIRTRNDLHQLAERDLGIFDQRDAGRDDFRQIVRRNVGRHAHGNAGGAVDQADSGCAAGSTAGSLSDSS